MLKIDAVIEVGPDGDSVLLPAALAEQLVELAARRSPPNDYASVAHTFAVFAEPMGSAAVDVGSDTQARWLDGRSLDTPSFGIRLTSDPDCYFVVLRPDGLVGIRAARDLPPTCYRRMQRFMSRGVRIEPSGLTSRDGTESPFDGGWLVVTPQGVSVADGRGIGDVVG